MKARTRFAFFGKKEQRLKQAAMKARGNGHHKLADELMAEMRESHAAEIERGPRVNVATGYRAAPNGKRWSDGKLIPRHARG